MESRCSIPVAPFIIMSEPSEIYKEFKGIMEELDFMDFESDKDCDAVGEIEHKLNAWGCKLFGHNWVFDQCGFWQHQFCTGCREGKYPDLARKKCSELTAEMKGISEAKYLMNKSLDTNQK
jgi:hypothetical protein